MFVDDSGSGKGYQIANSLRFRSSASAYLSRTQAAGSQTTWTWSGWVKLGSLSGLQYLFHAGGSIGSGLVYNVVSNDFQIEIGNGTTQYYARTAAVYRDPSAWYHVVAVADTNNATSTSRLRLYVNGTLQTIGLSSYPTSGFTGNVNQSGVGASVGRWNAANYYLDGYLSEINFIDGQALDPSYFGYTDVTTGAWVPKAYTGTYGTNGFYLPFNDGTSATTLCYDRSGNGNNWTPNNISTTAGATYDWMLDTPTNNYAVLNPLSQWSPITYPVTFSNGNLQASASGGLQAVSTIVADRFNSYWEASYTTKGSAVGEFGFIDKSGVFSGSYIAYTSDGRIVDSSTNLVTGLTTYATGDIIGVSLNASTLVASFYKNNALVTTYTLPNIGVWMASCFGGGTIGADSVWFNFGQRPFAYTPPTGFKALCTQNLPTPTVLNPKKHFDVDLYTGSGVARNRTGFQFQPDLVWNKSRSVAGSNHEIYDSVRGATKFLGSNITNAEGILAQAVTAFNTDGYSLGDGTSSNTNTNAATLVSWLWKAGGTAVTNTAGSITSQVSANTTAGFSIVTYTGTGANATVGHGLGVAPKMVIIKSRSVSTSSWHVLHASFNGGTNYAQYVALLESTSALIGPAATWWNSTAPTSSVISLGVGGTNYSAGTHVAYCFAEVPGFSKIGSYTGNGSTDGPFVWCGFRPRWVMIKQATGVAAHWYILDSARDTYNPEKAQLAPNLSNAEGVGADILDFTANGFKVRNSSAGSFNGSGDTYIFAAFAEQPFNFANAR